MGISGFHSFLEIFCVLNLGFAGSKSVRSYIGDTPDKIFERFLRLLIRIGIKPGDSLDSANRTVKLNEGDIVTKVLQNKFDVMIKIRDSITRRLNIIDSRFKSLPIKYRSIYLISGVYTLILMIVSGFEQIHGNFLFFGFLPPLTFLMCYSLLLFFVNFCPWFDKITNRIWLAVLLIFIYSATIFVLFLKFGENYEYFWKNKINETWIVTICIFAVILPFILFVLHHIIHYMVKLFIIIFGAFKMRKAKIKYKELQEEILKASLVPGTNVREVEKSV